MKFHTIKSERYNLRANGQYATYPIYEHSTGEAVGVLECYSSDVDLFLKKADEIGNIKFRPFYLNESNLF